MGPPAFSERFEFSALLLLGLSPLVALTPAFTLVLHASILLGRIPQSRDFPSSNLFALHRQLVRLAVSSWPVFAALFAFAFIYLHSRGVRLGMGLLLFTFCTLALLCFAYSDPAGLTSWFACMIGHAR
jgi:hypothetical protein